MICTQKYNLKDVNIRFTPGDCYGLIGANGSGMATFLKILSEEIGPNTGEVIIPSNQRLGVFKQNHFEFDEVEVYKSVIMGHKRYIISWKEKKFNMLRHILVMRMALSLQSLKQNLLKWTVGKQNPALPPCLVDYPLFQFSLENTVS